VCDSEPFSYEKPLCQKWYRHFLTCFFQKHNGRAPAETEKTTYIVGGSRAQECILCPQGVRLSPHLGPVAKNWGQTDILLHTQISCPVPLRLQATLCGAWAVNRPTRPNSNPWGATTRNIGPPTHPPLLVTPPRIVSAPLCTATRAAGRRRHTELPNK